MAQIQETGTSPAPAVDEKFAVENQEEVGGQLPSTPEAQQDTEKAQILNEEIERVQKKHTAAAGKKAPDLDAKIAAINNLKGKQEKELEAQRQADDAQFAENRDKFGQLDEQIQKLKETANFAHENNVDVKDIEQQIQTLIAQRDNLKVDNQERVSLDQPSSLQPQDAAKITQARKESEEEKEILDAKEEARVKQLEEQKRLEHDRLRLVAEEAEGRKQIEQKRVIVDQALTKLQEENANVEKIDPNRLWNNAATWQKVLAGIGMILGGKQGQKVVFDSIDRDIEAQKTDIQSSLARKQQMYKNVQLQMDRLENMTSDHFKKENLKIAKAEIAIKIKKLNQKRMEYLTEKMMNADLAGKISGKGGMLDREDVERINIQNPKLKVAGRALYLSNGKAVIMPTEARAKKVSEEFADLDSAIRDLSRLKEIAKDEPFGGAFGIFSTRPEAANLSRSVIGKLRIELFGPGVLTDTEQRLAAKIIPNVTDVFSLSAINRKKVETMIQKIRYGMKAKLKRNGIKLPESQNDRALKEAWAMHPKPKGKDSDEWNSMLINALIKKGKWSANEEF